MPVKASKKHEMLRRHQQVADLYEQAYTQTAIGERLGIPQATVSRDLKWVRGEWRASAVRDFDAARELELHKIDRVEREAWAAWDRSQKPAQSAVIDGDGNGQTARKTIKNQHGDLRALDIVLKCDAARWEILGLNAPTMIAPVMPDGKEPFKLAVATLSLGDLRTLQRLKNQAITQSEDERDGIVDEPKADDEADDEEPIGGDEETDDMEVPDHDPNEPADVRDD